MYWVLPYGGSLYIEGNENGETGLENFDMSKLGVEHSSIDHKNFAGSSVFSPGLSRCLDEMKSPTGDMSGKFRSFHGNQVFGNRAEASPMKLLMQHVSSQGKHKKEGSASGLKSPTLDNKNNLIASSQSTPTRCEHQSASSVNRGVVMAKIPTAPWFNLLPRDPCDKTTITNCWMPTICTQRAALDGGVPRRPGRPPKQATISGGGSSSGATKETLQEDLKMPPQPVYQFPSIPRPLTLDEVRRSVMESLRQDPATIPKGLCICNAGHLVYFYLGLVYIIQQIILKIGYSLMLLCRSRFLK